MTTTTGTKITAKANYPVALKQLAQYIFGSYKREGSFCWPTKMSCGPGKGEGSAHREKGSGIQHIANLTFLYMLYMKIELVDVNYSSNKTGWL